MGDPTQHLDMARCPEPGADDAAASSEEVRLEDPLYKYNARGYRLRVDSQNKWLRSENDPRGYRPASFSSHEWNRLSPEQKEQLRLHHSGEKQTRHNDDADPAAVSDNDDDADIANNADGIADGDFTERVPTARPRPPGTATTNVWKETDTHWVWYRNVPQRGHVNPNRLKNGPDVNYKTLTGQRRTRAVFVEDGKEVERVLEDFWDIPNGYLSMDDSYDVTSYEMIRDKVWTGVVEFKKSSPSTNSSGYGLPIGSTDTNDGIVWWKADDPAANEGVEPPPEERNPFKLATVSRRLAKEANLGTVPHNEHNTTDVRDHLDRGDAHTAEDLCIRKRPRRPGHNTISSATASHEKQMQWQGEDIVVEDDAEWTVILLCTEKDSLMKKCNPFGDRCKIVEITELVDFTSESGYKTVSYTHLTLPTRDDV